jgi:hypothetical protein
MKTEYLILVFLIGLNGTFSLMNRKEVEFLNEEEDGLDFEKRVLQKRQMGPIPPPPDLGPQPNSPNPNSNQPPGPNGMAGDPSGSDNNSQDDGNSPSDSGSSPNSGQMNKSKIIF